MIFVAASASPALIQTGPTAIYVMRSSNMVARSRNRWAGMLRFRSHCPACLSFRWASLRRNQAAAKAAIYPSSSGSNG